MNFNFLQLSAKLRRCFKAHLCRNAGPGKLLLEYSDLPLFLFHIRGQFTIFLDELPLGHIESLHLTPQLFGVRGRRATVMIVLVVLVPVPFIKIGLRAAY
jgi:hypothetical protein